MAKLIFESKGSKQYITPSKDGKVTLTMKEIREIDLTPLREWPDLRELILYGNQLSEIDLSPLEHCAELKRLQLHNNRLLEIDLSPLRNLRNLKELWLNQNQLSQIDLTPLQNLSDFYIFLDKNPIRELNLDNCHQINFKGISLESCNLTDIDLNFLSNSTVLYSLNLRCNNLREIELSPLQKCKKLSDLHLNSNQLSKIDLNPLAHCPNLTSISLGNNLLTNIDLTPLANCPNLTSISLGHNMLTNIDLSPLKDFPSLKSLYLDYNRLKNVDLTPLNTCESLEVLYLQNNLIETLDLSPVNKKLLLDIEQNPIKEIPIQRPQAQLINNRVFNIRFTWDTTCFISPIPLTRYPPHTWKTKPDLVQFELNSFGELQIPTHNAPKQPIVEFPVVDIGENEVTILNCPRCQGAHTYKLRIKRVVSLITGRPELIEKVFGRPAKEVASMDKIWMKKCTKSFTCPEEAASFNYTFIMKETNKSSVFSVEIDEFLR